VTAVEADATGLSVSLEHLPAPGFRDEEEPIFSMYGQWEIVSISRHLRLPGLGRQPADHPAGERRADPAGGEGARP
jgi:hypothetical protein